MDLPAPVSPGQGGQSPASNIQLELVDEDDVTDGERSQHRRFAQCA
jgi:hypothetical protein